VTLLHASSAWKSEMLQTCIWLWVVGHKTSCVEEMAMVTAYSY